MGKLVLRGVPFNRVFASSGVLNFYKDGWPYQKLLKLLLRKSYSFDDATFISKTTTLGNNIGNMPLDENFMPIEWFLKCIKVYPFKKLVLNAVALSGPGEP